MIDNKVHNMSLFVLICLSASICLSNGLSSAEDMLLKKDGTHYLGWAQPKGNFFTCSKNTITIGQGKIEKTQEKCPSDSGSSFFFGLNPSSFRLIGEVEDKDATTNTLKVKGETGGTKSFYYLPADLGPKSISLDELKVGEKITITGPMQGRADAITR